MAFRGSAASPLAYARTAGILLLVILACAGLGMMYVPATLIVPGDATATANNIRASESLFRLGIASDVVLALAEIVMVVVLYRLFEPVSRTLSLVAAFARLTMTVIQGANLLNRLAVLLVLGGAGYLATFGRARLDSLALLFLDVHAQVVFVWEAFFALHCLLLGYLIFKSGFLPRVLGVFMAVAAVGYATESFGNLLLPAHKKVFTAVLGVAVVGEFPFFLWLLFKGVDVRRWHELAGSSGEAAPPTSSS
ncbi:MAG: DUF4386 domain-containing protein [Planctomycetota bacterium]